MELYQKKRALEYFQNLMAEAFYESQANCPFKTGKLKHSGYYFLTEKGATITYTAPYFAAVQSGTKGGLETVPSHWRGTSFVRSYSRIEPPREPNPFRDSAVQKAIATFQETVKDVI